MDILFVILALVLIFILIGMVFSGFTFILRAIVFLIAIVLLAALTIYIADVYFDAGWWMVIKDWWNSVVNHQATLSTSLMSLV